MQLLRLAYIIPYFIAKFIAYIIAIFKALYNNDRWAITGYKKHCTYKQ